MANTITKIQLPASNGQTKIYDIKDSNAYTYTDNKMKNFKKEKTFIIQASQWINSEVVITDELFLTGEYNYFVSPSDVSYDEYIECGIRAKENVTNSMTLICKQKPVNQISINVCRIGG